MDQGYSQLSASSLVVPKLCFTKDYYIPEDPLAKAVQCYCGLRCDQEVD
jgi:hypothetical protein